MPTEADLAARRNLLVGANWDPKHADAVLDAKVESFVDVVQQIQALGKELRDVTAAIRPTEERKEYLTRAEEALEIWERAQGEVRRLERNPLQIILRNLPLPLPWRREAVEALQTARRWEQHFGQRLREGFNGTDRATLMREKDALRLDELVNSEMRARVGELQTSLNRQVSAQQAFLAERLPAGAGPRKGRTRTNDALIRRAEAHVGHEMGRGEARLEAHRRTAEVGQVGEQIAVMKERIARIEKEDRRLKGAVAALAQVKAEHAPPPPPLPPPLSWPWNTRLGKGLAYVLFLGYRLDDERVPDVKPTLSGPEAERLRAAIKIRLGDNDVRDEADLRLQLEEHQSAVAEMAALKVEVGRLEGVQANLQASVEALRGADAAFAREEKRAAKKALQLAVGLNQTVKVAAREISR